MDQLKNTTQETRLHFLDYWRIIRIRKTVILAVFLLVVITATVVTLMLPERYASTASIQVDQEHPDISGVGEMPYANGYDPYFLLTEFQTIQSHAVLSLVSDAMHLKEKWGKKYNNGQPMTEEEVEDLIKKNLDLTQLRNTKFIQIKAFSDNPQEAADLANQVAKSYKEYRSDEYDALKNGGIESLDQQLKEQDDKVKQAQDKVDELRTKLKINDAMANAPSAAALMTADRVRELDARRVTEEADYNSQKTLLETLKSQKPEELRQALPTAVNDTQLSDLLSELDLADQALIRMQIDYTPDHPKYKNAQKLVDDLNHKIDARVDGILVGLEAKVAAAKSALDTLTKDIADAEQTDIDTASKAAPYFAAKEDLEREQRLREVLALRVKQEGIDKALPKGRMVTIMDPANVDNKAVQPNKPLNIILGVVFGLVVGVGLAFFIEYLDTSVKTIDDVERALQA